MNCDEIKNKILKYLNSKGIEIILENNILIWNYNIYYSKFTVQLYFESIDYDKGHYSITYNSSYYSIQGLKRRRTSTLGNYCANIYKNLIFIQDKLNERAETIKKEMDNKNNYCLEIESHYKKIHRSVNLSSYQYADDNINICVYCYDNNKNVDYSIFYDKKINKYFLESKTETFSKDYLLEN